jgi:hypothetical protein
MSKAPILERIEPDWLRVFLRNVIGRGEVEDFVSVDPDRVPRVISELSACGG